MNPTAYKDRVCRDCKWFDGSACHKNPPQMALWPNDNQHPIMYTPYAQFPNVQAHDWCSHWESNFSVANKQS